MAANKKKDAKKGAKNGPKRDAKKGKKKDAKRGTKQAAKAPMVAAAVASNEAVASSAETSAGGMPEPEAAATAEDLRPGPGRPLIGSAPAETFPVRLTPELRTAIETRAEVDRTNASEVVRSALRQYLGEG